MYFQTNANIDLNYLKNNKSTSTYKYGDRYVFIQCSNIDIT